MLVSPSQSHFKFERLDQSPVGSFDSLASLQPKANGVRKSAGSYHRRSVSCLAVASHHEHYEHPSYYAASGRYYDTIEVSEGSASPVNHTRHVQRKSEGQISIGQLQRSLSNAGLVNVSTAAADGKPKDGKIDMTAATHSFCSGWRRKENPDVDCSSTVANIQTTWHVTPVRFHHQGLLYHHQKPHTSLKESLEEASWSDIAFLPFSHSISQCPIGDYTMVSVPSGPLSGKLVKVR